MTGFLWGVGLTLALGFAATLVADPEIRKACTGVMWALLASPVVLVLGMLAALTTRTGLRVPRVRARPLSTAALHRFVVRLDRVDGWVVTWRLGGFMFIHRKTDRKGTA